MEGEGQEDSRVFCHKTLSGHIIIIAIVDALFFPSSPVSQRAAGVRLGLIVVNCYQQQAGGRIRMTMVSSDCQGERGVRRRANWGSCCHCCHWHLYQERSNVLLV